MIPITSTLAVADSEITERFVRAMGSRGMNPRQEATAVELRFDVGASSLPDDMKARLIRLGGRTVTNHGVLVVMSRALRSQAINRTIAHERLVALLRRAAVAPRMRRQTRPRRIERERRLALKHARGAVKQLRARVR